MLHLRTNWLLSAVAATVITVIAAAVACSDNRPDESLKVGFIDVELIDQFMGGVPPGTQGPVFNSVLLAVKHVNDAGGVWGRPVETVFRTTPGSTAVEVATQMLDNEGVHGFIGPVMSTDVESVADELAKPRDVPFISSVSTVPFVADLDDDGYIFRSSMSDVAQGFALAQLAMEDHDEHVALVHRDDRWGRAIADSFKSHYSGRVSEVSLHPDKSTFADELTQISASGAPVLVLITFADMTDAVLDEVITHGHFDQVLLMNEHRSLALLAKYPEFLDGAKGVAPYGRHITEAEGHWEADYAAEYGEVPHASFMRETYDAAVAFMIASEHAGSTAGAAIRDSLYTISGPPGESFPATAEGIAGALEAVRNGADIDLEGEATAINWDDRGEVTFGHMGIWQFQDGNIVDLRHFDVDLSE